MENAINIILKHRYLQHDHVTLFCMRPVCKLFKNIAISAALERIKTADLTVTPLVNGTMYYGGAGMDDGYDTETYRHDNDSNGDPSVVMYAKKGNVQEGGHYPVSTENGERGVN